MCITYYHIIIINILISYFNSYYYLSIYGDKFEFNTINTFGTMDQNPLAYYILPIFTSSIITNNISFFYHNIKIRDRYLLDYIFLIRSIELKYILYRLLRFNIHMSTC